MLPLIFLQIKILIVDEIFKSPIKSHVAHNMISNYTVPIMVWVYGYFVKNINHDVVTADDKNRLLLQIYLTCLFQRQTGWGFW